VGVADIRIFYAIPQFGDFHNRPSSATQFGYFPKLTAHKFTTACNSSALGRKKIVYSMQLENCSYKPRQNYISVILLCIEYFCGVFFVVKIGKTLKSNMPWFLHNILMKNHILVFNILRFVKKIKGWCTMISKRIIHLTIFTWRHFERTF
jgi:hypothetical protein